MKRFVLLLSLLLLLTGLTACGGSASEPAAPSIPADWKTYQDPQGAFQLRYPPHLTQVDDLSTPNQYGVNFYTDDEAEGLYVIFIPFETQGLSDAQWEQASQAVVEFLLGVVGADAQTVLSRPTEGKHELYVEVRSEGDQTYGAIFVDERGGVVRTLFWVMPSDRWSEAKGTDLKQILSSFTWDPSKIQSIFGNSG